MRIWKILEEFYEHVPIVSKPPILTTLTENERTKRLFSKKFIICESGRFLGRCSHSFQTTKFGTFSAHSQQFITNNYSVPIYDRFSLKLAQ